MSYDLMVFDPAAAPMPRAEFLDWYDERTEWEDEASYDDPQRCTPALCAWLLDMVRAFPALNGPLQDRAAAGSEASTLADYSVGRELVYVCFQWSQVAAAFKLAFELAGRHGVGLFEASSDHAEVWLPDGNGDMRLAHRD